MKRDFDLIRSILLQVETAPSGSPIMQLGTEENITPSTFIEHLQIVG
jgi:hypothetical protein